MLLFLFTNPVQLQLALKIIYYKKEKRKSLEVEPKLRRLNSTSSQLLECGKYLDFLGF